MAMQTNFEGDELSVTVNVIDENGAHVAQSGDFAGSTAFVGGVDQSLSNPTVTTIGTGVYRLSWTGVSGWLVEDADVTVMVHGATAAGSWTPFGIAVSVKKAERGTDGASTFDHTTDEVITDAASRAASKADVSSLATQAELDKVPKKNVSHTYTSATGTSDVTITEA